MYLFSIKKIEVFQPAVTLLFIFASVLSLQAQSEYHKLEVSAGYLFERADGFSGDVYASTTTIGTTSFNSQTGTYRKRNLNGFSAAAVYNFSRYFGAKFEFSGNFGSDSDREIPGGAYRTANGTILVIPSITGINARQRDYKFLGGLQIKDNSKDKKIKPFGYALFGAARQTTEFTNLNQQFSNINGGNKVKTNGFSMALGGGLDVRLSKRVDLRVFQIDYNPVFNKEKVMVPLGASVDSTLNLPGGSVVTTLQDVRIPKRTQQNFRIGFGIVFH